MKVAVLSPHRDDAAFSCGLLLRALLRAGACISIVNICTRSAYAPFATRTDADTVADITNLRAREDEAFVARLERDAGDRSRSVGLIDLAWEDAPVRWRIGAEETLASHPVRPLEQAELCRRLRALPEADMVLAPLALGGHVDHALVRAAALDAIAPERLLFYEDLPYAARLQGAFDPSMLPAHCTRFALLPPHAVAGCKREYALCYPSQIEEDTAGEMERYAHTLGARERFFGQPRTLERLRESLQSA